MSSLRLLPKTALRPWRMTARSCIKSNYGCLSNNNAFQQLWYHNYVPADDPAQRKDAFRQRWQEETERALMGGGLQRMEKQHLRGSLTARERFELLFDPDTFCELDQLKAHRCVEFGMDQPNKQFPGDGIVTG